MKQGSWYEKNSHPAEAKSNTSKVSYSSHTDENIADEVSYDYCSNEEMNEDRLLATSAASESFHRSVLENQVKRTALNRSNTSRLIQNNNNNNNINTATNLLKKEITRQNKTTSNRISQNHFESQVILEKQSDKCFHISRYARYKLCKLKGHSGTIVVKQLVPTAEAFISKLKSPTSAVGTRNDNDDNNEEEDNDEGDISNAPPEVVQKFRDVLLREADTIAAAFNSKINYTTSTETIAALIGITPETHSILMDFHACGSLDDWIVQRVPIKWMDRWIIARDAVNGMCHLHSIGIVHGNLRCHNILMAYDDRKKVTVRISDYGFHGKKLIFKLEE